MVTQGLITLVNALVVHADAGRDLVVDAGVRFALRLLGI